MCTISGGCEATVTLFQNFAESSAVSEFGCRAIYHLSSTPVDEDNIRLLGRAGACEEVVRALKSHLKSASACTQSCLAIKALAVKNDENGRKLVSAGCVDAIIDALRTHTNSAEFLKSALRAIAYLCTTFSSIAVAYA